MGTAPLLFKVLSHFKVLRGLAAPLKSPASFYARHLAVPLLARYESSISELERHFRFGDCDALIVTVGGRWNILSLPNTFHL